MQSISSSQRNVENPSPNLVLYSYWESSCAWRVRFALKLKGLPYEYRAVDLSKGEHFSPEFERLNPLHYVPVLIDGDMVISDSFAILLYLEEKYPQKTLLPEDPQQRALNMQAASIVSSSIQPLHMGSTLKYIRENVGPEASFLWAQSSIEKGFVTLEKLLQDVASNYATGETLFLADVFLAPQIAVAETRFKIDMSKFPTLGRIFQSYKVLPEFAASLPSAQPDAVP
ncbi:glutathione S-transferase 2-like isoform X2 [Mercurialis annua]|uniref:glutathione S-transferase 2-like isoform X2 n=1 Tax=Mercurialis annua TaxID=3986 RepID=UPI00215FC786|nr:glutathione S-transferase 2-like isoform X2 [Mercurialis annua]XP_055962410.1 glutathione S-transferase 2-like isoform X2 [Mercurialis annua]